MGPVAQQVVPLELDGSERSRLRDVGCGAVRLKQWFPNLRDEQKVTAPEGLVFLIISVSSSSSARALSQRRRGVPLELVKKPASECLTSSSSCPA